MAEFRRSGGANVVRATQLTPGECGGGNGRRPVARERARNPGERGGGKGRLPTARARATNFCKSTSARTAELMASAVIACPDYSCLRGRDLFWLQVDLATSPHGLSRSCSFVVALSKPLFVILIRNQFLGRVKAMPILRRDSMASLDCEIWQMNDCVDSDVGGKPGFSLSEMRERWQRE
ncbi:hypothetical protein CASFOL_034956 [Castilleja foliolosa]|uniref:Uncharacterized protein n=1 Tax=Castilleja foliolosa TaxID=1961234 RepID=A0ABD3BS75_9LAMI